MCSSYDSGSQQKPVLVLLAVYSTSRVILRRLIGIHGKPHEFLISGESPEAKGSCCRSSWLSTYTCCQNNDFFSPTFKSSVQDSILKPCNERDSVKCRSRLLLYKCRRDEGWCLVGNREFDTVHPLLTVMHISLPIF